MERGIVIQSEGNRILVEARANACCAGCSAEHACAMAGEGTRRLWMQNSRGARVGDEVAFVIEPRAVVLSSFILYLLPVAALIAGLVFGAVHPLPAALESEASSLLWGFGGLVLAFLSIRLLSHFLKKKSMFEPRLADVEEKAG